ncbi:FAD-binding protein [Chloroflexota bacterium]
MLVGDEVQWRQAADVVVVGFGAAGAVAAMTAHDSGAEVLILEKQLARNHITTSSMSGGIFICPSDVPSAIEYMEHISRADEGLYWTDREVISTWAKYSSQNKEWVVSRGGNVKLLRSGGEHKLPGSESIDIYLFAGMGRGLMKFINRQVETRNIQVMYNTAADKLLTNAWGEVVGVSVLSKGKHSNIKAARAVIMAPGGFEFDETMKLNYLKVHPCYFAGTSANTGDGIRMVQEVGAALWHMNCCSAAWVLKYPEMPIALGPNFRGSKNYAQWGRDTSAGNPCGYIIVDRYGKRFTSEEYKRHALYYELALYDSQKQEYPRIPSYWLFDRKRIEAGPLPSMWYGPMQHRLYQWSRDNREEIEKGYIVQADTIEKLAQKLQMEPSVLKRTWQDFNLYCERKEDSDFHRPPQHLVPLIEPPFFAVKLWPGSANTQGGPRRNHRAQVLNTDNKPIPKLYAAGEFGSIYGMLYPAGGGNIAECIAFGRIAGENAAGCEPAG